MTDTTSVVNVLQEQNKILSRIAECVCKLEECVCAGSPATSSKVRMQLQWISGFVVIDTTGWFCFDPPYDGTINSLTYFTGTDSFDIEVQINGSPVTGLTGLTAGASPATATATAANTFTAGQPITGVITGTTGTPTQALLSLAVTWA